MTESEQLAGKLGSPLKAGTLGYKKLIVVHVVYLFVQNYPDQEQAMGTLEKAILVLYFAAVSIPTIEGRLKYSLIVVRLVLTGMSINGGMVP